MNYLIVILFSLFLNFSFAQSTPYELSKGKETATYQQAIDYYRLLDSTYREITIEEIGITDSGKPLTIIKITNSISGVNKCRVLINNGIHPGEPEGIDASMMLARDLLKNKKINKFLDKIELYIIPIYNIEGSLHRSATSRVNQNGPIEYGFRGNGQNLDLNRDFIKCDSKNAELFATIFQKITPHLLIDTHTSNGSNYQYTLTYVATQKDELYSPQAVYFENNLIPAIANSTKSLGFEMIPYVNSRKTIPNDGIDGFFDSPRYSTGYASLFNCLGFMVETHMLKEFDKRVKATYSFLLSSIIIASKDAETIIQLQADADTSTIFQQEFPISYSQDTSQFAELNFKGFTAKYKESKVSGKPRLFYDESKPIQFPVRFYNEFVPNKIIIKPAAYIIPQAYQKVIKLLNCNGVEMYELVKDTFLIVESYKIDSFKTFKLPYEGHYYHYQVYTTANIDTINYFRGDKVIITNQKTNKYLVETLEPEAKDSFFSWNFFDGVLNQKEGFSDYVFEDVAADMLKKNKTLKDLFEKKKLDDAKFASDGNAQLDYLYKQSIYYEKTHNRYPVTRILSESQIPKQILSY